MSKAHDKKKIANNKDIISIALSIIYEASNQDVESCTFTEQKARLTYKDKSSINFDLNKNIDNDQKSKLMNYMVKT
jgi:hypothetical protein